MIPSETEQRDSESIPGKISLPDLKILIRGAGEMASGVAWRLYISGWRHILMTETQSPLAVRRSVSFCEALSNETQIIEGVKAKRAETLSHCRELNCKGFIGVMEDPHLDTISEFAPDVMVDAIMAKRNLGTFIDQADLVIALGPGFVAGKDADYVIETNRGHNLGRVICSGFAEADTGTPGEIGGQSGARVLRAPGEGAVICEKKIGDLVIKDELIATVNGLPVMAPFAGVLRGLIKSGTHVRPGLKIGDVDPRGDRAFCRSISEKARAIGGATLEAILRRYNK